MSLRSRHRGGGIFAVAPDPTGKLLYLHARGVGLETDRFTPEDFHLILYDLEAHEVRETLRLPQGVKLDFFDTLVVSPDGLSLRDRIGNLRVEHRDP